MKSIVVPASRWPGNGITRTQTGRRKMKMKLAADCIPCPNGCGEPWCPDCQEHYADCSCSGPHSEENMSDILVVTSKVKALAKAKDIRTGAEFVEKLSAKVQGLIDGAIAKAVAAERKTLKAEDLE